MTRLRGTRCIGPAHKYRRVQDARHASQAWLVAPRKRDICAFSALRSPLGRRKKERRGARARRSAGKAERCCVRRAGEEDDRHELKPLAVVQRVRRPPGKGQPTSRKRALHVCGNATREAYGSRCQSCVLAPKSAIAEAFAVNAAGAAST